MALHTQKEFAELCGISLANLSTYKGRGKIELTENKVDDKLPINASFLQKQLSKKGKLSTETGIKTQENEQYATASEDIIDKKRENAVTKTAATGKNGSLHELEKEKKALDIQKTSEEIELLKKKNEKMEGELVPTGMVSNLLKLHFTSATNQFKNSIENILTEWTKKKDFTREELAELRGHMTGELNKSIQQSVKESQKNLHKLIEDFSARKSVGERM